MNIIFFGPPGSGKGTQAKILCQKLNITHLSTGDILREKLKDNDELSFQLKKTMSSGNLVSDNILNQIISSNLISNSCIRGFILDGYPRTLSQSEFLLSFSKTKNLSFDFIFDFEINFNIVKERIVLRSEEEQRSDDCIDVIETRLSKYLDETLPVSQFFADKFSKNYFKIDASEKVSEIENKITNIIKNGNI